MIDVCKVFRWICGSYRASSSPLQFTLLIFHSGNIFSMVETTENKLESNDQSVSFNCARITFSLWQMASILRMKMHANLLKMMSSPARRSAKKENEKKEKKTRLDFKNNHKMCEFQRKVGSAGRVNKNQHIIMCHIHVLRARANEWKEKKKWRGKNWAEEGDTAALSGHRFPSTHHLNWYLGPVLTQSTNIR